MFQEENSIKIFCSRDLIEEDLEDIQRSPSYLRTVRVRLEVDPEPRSRRDHNPEGRRTSLTARYALPCREKNEVDVFPTTLGAAKPAPFGAFLQRPRQMNIIHNQYARPVTTQYASRLTLMNPETSRPRPPLWTAIVGGLVLTSSTVMMFVGAWTVGTTWDERNQVIMLQTYLDTGWHLAPDALVNGIPDPNYLFGSYVYGPVGELVAHTVSFLLRIEPWSTQSVTAVGYGGRHTGIALMALVGVLSAGVIVKLITQSWRWALLSAALLSVTPLWLGHGMFNIKDLPAAVGYTIASMGIVALCRPDFFTRRRIRFLALISIVAGSVLAAGTRTALGLPIAFAVVVSVLAIGVLRSRASVNEHRPKARVSRRLAEGLLAMVAAYLVLAALYPKAYLNPINLGINAVRESAVFPVSDAQLTAGTWMLQPVPWSYLPLWFGAQLPLLTIIFSTIAIIWWLVSVATGIVIRFPNVKKAGKLALYVPVLLQLLLLPVASIIGHSTLYNGTRQVLFVVPAISILAILGVRKSILWLSQTSMPTRRISVPVLWSVIMIGLLAPLLAQVRLFPYNYTYFNEIASVKPIDGNWPTDYWRASSRELLAHVPEDGPESCGFEQLQKGEFFPCSEQPMFTPYLNERGTEAIQGTLEEGQYWFVRENSGNLELPPGCVLHDTITRSLIFRDITIGQIAKCDSAIDTGVRNMIDPGQPIPGK